MGSAHRRSGVCLSETGAGGAGSPGVKTDVEGETEDQTEAAKGKPAAADGEWTVERVADVLSS